MHPPQHVLLAQLSALGINEGIEGRRRFRQTGQHRGLRNGDVRQGLAVIGTRSSSKTKRALTQKYLVDVQLKDLILSQLVLNFESERYLIGLAQVPGHTRPLTRQEEIARHLHGDRAGARALPADCVGVGRAQRCKPVHAGVIIKIGVLGRENRLPHMLRHLGELDQAAPLFTKLR